MTIGVEFSRADFAHLVRYLEEQIEETEEMAEYYKASDDEANATKKQHTVDQLRNWLACMYGTETA